ncbi:MAG TPA: exodeoxyribonuclease V subunit alpha [Kiritimatiellia bacterium]|nr:exodeoxyribonuclease V subunit alpha [Kiritimatiellia bacterium]HMO99167.1 exodeoxyribonuclease V subunit alpha [Kiritimatiellia bacterium]HMP95754.1 exodeoxyribonuclease V subunit alpha [Kiritimatiellia bacterium]
MNGDVVARVPWPEQVLSMGRMVARMHGGVEAADPELAAWAAVLYAHLLEGRVYLELDAPFAGLEFPPLPVRNVDAEHAPDWLAVAPTGSGEKPLVLSGRRLWFARYYDFDERLRAALSPRRHGAPIPLDEERLISDLRFWFSENLAAGDHGQPLAAAHLIDRRFGLLTGGPGTGKTTSLARLLLIRFRQCDPQQQDPVYLVAPTGKAASRLRQSLTNAAAGLRVIAGSNPEWLPWVSYLDPADPNCRILTMTLHKALAARGVRREGQGPFRHDRSHPLAASMVVVDEVSMVDLALMTRLVEAIPDAAPLLLVGDAEQLKSVEAGPVLAQWAAESAPLTSERRAMLARRLGLTADQFDPEPVRGDHHVRLTRNYRFGADSDIARFAAAVNAGDADAALSLLREAPSDDAPLVWLPLPDDGFLQPARARTIILGRHGYGPLRELLAEGGAEQTEAVAAFERFRVLCAIRGGPDGAERWNERLQAWMVDRPGAAYPRAVLVTANDPVSGLSNGDSGLVLAGRETGEAPRFYTGERSWPAALLPAHEPGWAMTIHKSQGSETETALIVLPREGGEGLLSRRLLYTAVTRARRRVILLASASALRLAIQGEREDAGG